MIILKKKEEQLSNYEAKLHNNFYPMIFIYCS